MSEEKASEKYFQKGNTAVITGASSGIGRAAALMCASRGMNVWLVDVDEPELEIARDMTKEKAQSSEQMIETAIADVSDLSAMETLCDKVYANGGRCNFLMNNAGIMGAGGPVSDVKNFDKVMKVNTYGPIHGCVAFLPKMKESTDHDCLIVNTGSKQGITMPPGNLAYNISKAALKTYTEGLEHELMKERRDNGCKVRAALLVPGWVNTSILLKLKREEAKEAGKDFDESEVFFHENKPNGGAWMPSQLVDFMVEELDKGRFYIICPDNDVDRETDNLRMTWTMQDLTENREPLSRWHPDYADAFAEFITSNKGK